MKTRLNARALVFIALLFSTLAVAEPAPATDSEQMTQLLDQLGLRALLEQAPAVLAAVVEVEGQANKTVPQAANWRHELEAQLQPQRLLQTVAHYLHDRYRADVFRRAQQRLQEPLAKRVRYFDLAMTQAGAEKNLRDFLSQDGLSQDGLSQNGLSANGLAPTDLTQTKPEQDVGTADKRAADARRTLLREVDAATASSLLTATLQSAIAARVRKAAGNGAVDAAVLRDEIAERQRYLAPLAVNYLLYDYRYLRDDELREYRDLMRDDAVQWLLDSGRQAVLAAIVGELTPPPNPPQ